MPDEIWEAALAERQEQLDEEAAQEGSAQEEPFHPFPEAVADHYCSACDGEYYELEGGEFTPCCCKDSK